MMTGFQTNGLYRQSGRPRQARLATGFGAFLILAGSLAGVASAAPPPGTVSGGGGEYTAAPSSVAELTLLDTIPAAPGNRYGYSIQAQCTAGLTVALQDTAGGPSFILLAALAADGGQGGNMSMAGMPYSGSIEIYSSDASCKHSAWVNQ